MLEQSTYKELPKVSVVIPVYQMQDFLPETLDSVLASDYSNFEIIIVDDGSKDRSYEVACSYAKKHTHVTALTKPNSGASGARNFGIARAKGSLILPVDADNLIHPTFISKAVNAIMRDEEIKVVAPSSQYFGEKTGPWKLPPFSLRLLARKNIIDCCALFRKADWERIGGYNEDIPTREDWAFWIALLKNGGKVIRLPEILLSYRVRSTSKRVTNRRKKFLVIDRLNQLHPEFFQQILHGPLHHRRTWSMPLNILHRLTHPRHFHINPKYAHLQAEVKALPAYFKYNAGTLLHRQRNELRELTFQGLRVVAKSYQTPNLINRIVYGLLRPSKAKRSFNYANKLRSLGIHSPEPVAYFTEHCFLLFSQSYYVCLKSSLNHSYADLINADFPDSEPILRAIARTAAKLHDAGMIHKDFSRGNILFDTTPKGISVEIIDLNRIRFHKPGIEEGCRNFERLPATPEMLAILADEYARARGFNSTECLKLMQKYNHAQP